MTAADRKAALQAWDNAVCAWRLSSDACVNESLSDAEKFAIRTLSTHTALVAIQRLGGYSNGYDGPAAIALGWA